jgi:hypothetical protein
MRKWESRSKDNGRADCESVYREIYRLNTEKEKGVASAKDMFIDGDIDRDQYAIYHAAFCLKCMVESLYAIAKHYDKKLGEMGEVKLGS